MGKFPPEDFTVTDQMRAWARSKGLSNKDIDAQTEIFIDHEFRRPYTDWVRVWRNWIRKSIQIGSVEIQRTLDDEADELGITRQPNESDESLKRRIGIAATMRAYNLEEQER